MLRIVPPALLLLFGGVVTHVVADTELNLPGYHMLWNDEFEGATVDGSKWEVNRGANAWYIRASDGLAIQPALFSDEPFIPWTQFGTINDERQYYHPGNVSVQNGMLVMESREESVANPVGFYNPAYHKYTSGKVNSADEFTFQYGVVRIRAQVPGGKGIWPALWMMDYPVPWFWNDEIDILEARGSKPTETTSAHHFKVNGNNQFNSASLDVGVNYQAGFHEYSLDWESHRIRTYVDGQLVLDDSQAVPQAPMFLLMNTAVGGFFDGVPDATTTFPQFFNVDWVRVWQQAAKPGDAANGDFVDYQGAQWANWNTRDDGNLSTAVGGGALHGSSSLLMDVPPSAATGGRGPNMFTDGTAGGWSGWLNEFDAGFGWITGYPIDPLTVPATVSGGMATFGLYQGVVSPVTNAVIFRQIGNGDIGGKSVTFTGNVTINTPFTADTEVRAFIRVFDSSFGISQNVNVSVKNGGSFTLHANVPGNSPFVQFGLDTIGTPGSAGQMTAMNLYVSDDAVLAPPTTTHAEQTVLASPGQSFRAGVVAASDGNDPLSEGATAQLMLDFLNSSGGVVSSQSFEILRGDTPGPPRAQVLQASAPPATTQARLRLERKTVDELTETGGKVLWDVASLQDTGNTDLPVFVVEPASTVSVNSGDPVNLNVTVLSSSPLSFQWYRNGVPAGMVEDLGFRATEADAGSYFLVASNDAGPVVGAVTDVSVAPPGLQAWKESYGVGAAGILSDDEPDSVTLLEEYAFNLDPAVADFAYLDPGVGSSGLPLVQMKEDSGNPGEYQLVVEYVRRLGDSYLEYAVEFGSDLGPESWSSVTEEETVTPIDDVWERVIVADSVSTSTHPRRFGRVMVKYTGP